MNKLFSFLFFLSIISCSKDPILYTLTTSANPTEGGTLLPITSQFEEGETVVLNATPSEEYTFFSWAGVSGENSNTSIVMDSDKTIVALFVKKQYSLEISVEGEGEVTEKIIKAGASTDYNSGTIVELSASPASEWVFIEWKGDLSGAENPAQITINKPKNITAVFEKKQYHLNIEIEGEGSVEETIIKAGTPNSYNSGTVVSLNAVPQNGWSFLKWSGDISSFENPIEITVNMPKNIQAEFFNPLSFTGLPILYVDTEGSEINSKENYIEGSVSIIGTSNFPGLSSSEMKIKGRGNSTWWQGGIGRPDNMKKPFQIKFGDKTEVLNMPKDKKWVLLAEISDISLIRNKIAREIANLGSFDYVPQAEYTELFINDKHAGTYLIGQKVEESKNRVNIGDDGYLVEIDTDAHGRIEEDDVYFRSNVWSSHYEDGVFNIKEPSLDFDSEKFNLIKDHINTFEGALFGDNFKDPDLGYRSFIDLPSFIDWFLVNEISKNQDAASFSSIYFNYIPGGEIKMGPVWDFDLAFGNVNYSNAENPEGFWIKDNLWYKRMFEDPYFKQMVQERFDYYNDNLNSILSKISGIETYLSKSQKKNFELYPSLLDPSSEVWPVPARFDNHHAYVEYLKTWLDARMMWLKTWL
ncbi:CotH kinase family protein [Flavobacteriaceae bacterium]|nr:CotH kinase family protein [Flavobacteriaceae bacterium]